MEISFPKDEYRNYDKVIVGGAYFAAGTHVKINLDRKMYEVYWKHYFYFIIF